jgi:2-dehydro-3-deoxyphosphogluconate aldolase/(4S)-4-hydroxy-2-oxoglutarate aldolase
VSVVEITLTTPGALAGVRDLTAQDVPGAVVGAGTVLDERSARDVIAAGAHFVVSPTLDDAVMRCCREANVPCMPGALTPRELLEASRAGASHIKLFPASLVGPRYIREVLAPLPFLRLVPSGGVSLDNAGDWIRAGAIAVSVGSALVSPSLVAEQAWDRLTAQARALIDRVAEARRRPAEAPA